jgi:hypothetical protein
VFQVQAVISPVFLAALQPEPANQPFLKIKQFSDSLQQLPTEIFQIVK